MVTEYHNPEKITCQEMTPTIAVPRMYRLGDLLQDFSDDAMAAHEAYKNGTARGPVSGFPTLDREIGGAFMPGLHVIHGGPGTGKTALALQIAATCGTPALFVSCEISPLEILRRLAARVTCTYLGRFKNGELHEVEAVKLAERACEKSPALGIVDGTSAFPGSDWLYERAEELRGDARHLLLVVDSLHTWTARAQMNKTEYDALNTALSSLEQLAGSLKAPVLVIAERNRGNMESGGMSAGKGSSRIEYAGETVMGMNTTMDQGRPIQFDVNGERVVKLWIEKNRHGEGGNQIPLFFHGAFQRFQER